MSQEPPYKRTQYLVDRRYQLQFTTRLFMAVLTVATLSALVASALMWRSLYLPGDQSYFTLSACLIAIAITLFLELLLAIPIILILGIRQSHRVVGPINRIKQALEAIGNGDFSQRTHLRQGDALEDLAKSINTMAERLQQRFPRPPG